ncbi:MAG: hypothetical protein LBT12_01520 [Oscillospiraceae bacterium]|nr:hypothetical protein [Oscillospiraceae bacterium]
MEASTHAVIASAISFSVFPATFIINCALSTSIAAFIDDASPPAVLAAFPNSSMDLAQPSELFSASPKYFCVKFKLPLKLFNSVFALFNSVSYFLTILDAVAIPDSAYAICSFNFAFSALNDASIAVVSFTCVFQSSSCAAFSLIFALACSFWLAQCCSASLAFFRPSAILSTFSFCATMTSFSAACFARNASVLFALSLYSLSTSASADCNFFKSALIFVID